MEQLEPLKVGVIGTGMINRIYMDNIHERFSIVKLAAVADRKVEKAVKTAERYEDVKACSIDELLEDPSIDIVLNLTPPYVHREMLERILEAGKHAYTEKTFTMNTAEAAELMRIADEKHLLLGSAPDTFFASWVQKAREVIDSGRLGRITSFVMAGNRDNDRMLPVMPYMNKPGGGVLLDYCVYYLTILINLLGPVSSVSAKIKAPYRQHLDNFEHSPHFGEMIDTPNESQIYSILELENGITGTLSINSDSCLFDQTYFAIYGNKGILYLACPDWFNGELSLYENTYDFEHADQPVRLKLEDPYAFKTNSRGVGIADMAWAIREHREPRVSAERCYHVLEIEERMMESNEKNGQFCSVLSSCRRSLPLTIPTEGEESSLITVRRDDSDH